MLIPSRAWGFVRVGLNGRFGVTVPNFGTGGTDGNPLDNDVDAGDEAAGVEFCPVFAAQPSSGTLTVWTDGSLSQVGAADGAYVLPYDLYTFTPGDSASVDEGATTYTVTVGSAADGTASGATLRAAARFVGGGAVGTGASVAPGATLRAAARFTGGSASAVRNPTAAGVALRAAVRFYGGGAFVPGDGQRHGRLGIRIGLGL